MADWQAAAGWRAICWPTAGSMLSDWLVSRGCVSGGLPEKGCHHVGLVAGLPADDPHKILDLRCRLVVLPPILHGQEELTASV